MVTMRHLSIPSCLSLAVLLCCLWGSRASVVEDFNHMERCKDSLYMGTPPRGYPIRGPLKKICQRYENKPRFVTLFDKHIPLYSAYIFKKSDGDKRVDSPWMFEPQLASEKGTSNMEPFPQSSSHMHMNFEDSQAVLEDYADVVQYERGHLNPDEHQADPLDKGATYTLTNVVPQVREFNIGPWAEHKDLIRRRLNNYCRGKAYVVTGVTTSGNMIRRNNVDRVAIPEYMWSAYCCTDFDQNAPYFVRYKFPVFGAYGMNDRVNNHLTEVPVNNLEKFLKGRMDVDKNFQIFYNDCVPES